MSFLSTHIFDNCSHSKEVISISSIFFEMYRLITLEANKIENITHNISSF